MSLTEGTSIGQYRVIRKIGEGGMGAVYLAQHALIGRQAAIKVLLPALCSQREVVDRFFNEARATTAVSDAGIVQVFDFGFHTDNSAYIVMELLEGESLESRIHRGTISVVDALRITRQVAGSLAAAHGRGIVHRDLKPDNLYMVRDAETASGERPKILDFGIAKLTSDAPDRTRTRTGLIMGTPVYMSPEQCRGSGSIDHRADIYSLGCVLFHMLTGHPPFDLEGVGEIISAHLRETAKPPSALVPGLAPGVDDLVLRCLEKPPEQRFQTMTELQAECDRCLARITGAGALTIALPASMSTTKPTTISGSAGERHEPPRRRNNVWLAIAGVGVAVAIVATIELGRHREDQAIAPAATPIAEPVHAVPPDAAVVVEPVAIPPIAVAPVDAMPVAIAPPDAPTQVAKPKHVNRPTRPTVVQPQRPSQEDAYDSR